MEIKILKKGDSGLEKEYRAFAGEAVNATVYSTLEWRDVLLACGIGKEAYFIAREGGRIIGAIPCFYKSSQGKSIINSMPIVGGFGGYGGLLLSPGLTENEKETAAAGLFEAIDIFAKEINCVTFTISLPPMSPSVDLVKRTIGGYLTHESFCQINDLETSGGPNERIKRAIKKAQKFGVTVHQDIDDRALSEMYEYYSYRMTELHSNPKPFEVFDAIYKILAPAGLAKIFKAECSGRHVGGLLVLCCRGMVDYYVPYVKPDSRHLQSNSLVIGQAMEYFKEKGFKHWNWQASTAREDSIYAFKENWGAKTVPYYYFTKCYYPAEEILKNRETYASDFGWYFLLPAALLGRT